MFSDELRYRAFELLNICRTKEVTLATAESCTGGLIAALFTEIPGSSDVFERGYVTYSNASKKEMLGVPSTLIDLHGAVSYEVAESMAKGALLLAQAGRAISVTGIAGPGGGNVFKPVGLVYIAVAMPQSVQVERNFFTGTRNEIRLASVEKALGMLRASLTPSYDYVV